MKATEYLLPKQIVNQVGLCDVVAGRMWFLCMDVGNTLETSYFWTKRELEQYIRTLQDRERKRTLLRKLRETHGRAYAYAR